jgi:putative ABC transport system permease protein
VAQVLFPSQSPLGRPIKINQVWLRVVGVIKDRNLTRADFQGVALKGEQNRIYLPLQTALRRFAYRILESEIDEFRIQIEPGESTQTAAAGIDYLLQKRHKNGDDYEIIVPEALLAQNRKTQNIFTIVMACIAGISLLVGGMGVMNIMLASVLERTAEIGLRRALGATERDIKRQFLLETFTVSSIGGLIGIFFGFALSGAIAFFAGWTVGWSLWAVLLSVGVCSLVGLVFGIYPAVQASRLNPIEALRHD